MLRSIVADLSASYNRERETFIYVMLPLFSALFVVLAFCAFPLASLALTGALALSALLGAAAGAVGVRLERWLASKEEYRPTSEQLAIEAGRRAEMAEEARWNAVPVVGAFPAPPCLDIDGGTVAVAPVITPAAPEAPAAVDETSVAVAALPTVAAPEAPALVPVAVAVADEEAPAPPVKIPTGAKMAKMTVAQLRALASDASVKLASKAKKEDIIATLLIARKAK